jgi:hypothetical protein
MHDRRIVFIGMAGIQTRALMSLASMTPPRALIVVDPIHAPARTEAEIIATTQMKRDEEKIQWQVMKNFVGTCTPEGWCRQMREAPKRPFYHGAPRKRKNKP